MMSKDKQEFYKKRRMEIYVAYKLLDHQSPYQELLDKYHITRSRLSQIVNSVEKEIASKEKR